MEMQRLPVALSSTVAGLPRILAPRLGGIKSRYVPMICRRSASMYGYTQAKALVYSKTGEPTDVLRLHTHSISPSIPSSNILLRALAAPINPADINQIQGVYPSAPPFTTDLGFGTPCAVTGNEGCFEIVSVGSQIKDKNLQKGDWVIMRHSCFGTWRTHALAKEEDILKVENRQGLSPTQVATVGVNPVTAWRLLKDFGADGGLKEGDWFIQNGANSAVGRAAIQLGREWGFKSINVIRQRPTEEETDALKKELLDLGATKVVTQQQLLFSETRDMVKEWTNGGREPVKLGLNCVGGKVTAALGKLLSPRADLVTYGGMSKEPLRIPVGQLIFRDLKLSGFWVSRWSDEHPHEKKETVHEILDLIRDGRFKDGPVDEIRWERDSDLAQLTDAIKSTLEGYRGRKAVYIFGDS